MAIDELPFYVVVSGPPGSGKTTLAAALADRLGLPLFAKDTVKETLLDALPPESVEESQRLGAAAIAVLLALAIENGRGVLESTWRASLATDELRTLPAPVVEVFCECEPDTARARYRERASERHPGHFDDLHVERDDFWTGERAAPVDGGWPVLRVDTMTGVDITAVCAAIVEALEER